MNANPMTIEDYLQALRRAFGNAPPGLVADALADAEEHLRNSLASGQSEADAIRNYGAPQEVAAEYLAAETRPTGPFAPPLGAVTGATHRPWPGFFGVVRDPVTYGALLYMLLAGVTGIFYFTWAVAGISLSLGLAILIIGFPFFLLFIGSVRLFSYFEGRLIEVLLGVRMPRRLPAAAPAISRWENIKEVLRDRRTWSSIVYMLLMLPLGLAYCITVVASLCCSGFLVVGGSIYIGFLIRGVTLLHDREPGCADCIYRGIFFHQGAGGTHLHNTIAWLDPWALTPVPALAMILAGIVIFFLLLHLARLAGWLQGRIAEHLLVRLSDGARRA